MGPLTLPLVGFTLDVPDPSKEIPYPFNLKCLGGRVMYNNFMLGLGKCEGTFVMSKTRGDCVLVHIMKCQETRGTGVEVVTFFLQPSGGSFSASGTQFYHSESQSSSSPRASCPLSLRNVRQNTSSSRPCLKKCALTPPQQQHEKAEHTTLLPRHFKLNGCRISIDRLGASQV